MLAFLPSLLTVVLFACGAFLLRELRGKEYSNSLLATFVWGMAMVIPVTVFKLVAMAILSPGEEMTVPDIVSVACLQAAVETVLLFLALYADTHRARLYRRRSDGVLIALFLYGGLALADTLYQAVALGDHNTWMIYPLLPAYLLAGGLMGFFYGRTKDYPVPVVFNNGCAILLPGVWIAAMRFAIVAQINGVSWAGWLLWPLTGIGVLGSALLIFSALGEQRKAAK